MAFSPDSFLWINYLIIIIRVHQLINGPIHLVTLKRLKDFYLVSCHVKWLYLDLVIWVRAHAVVTNVFKMNARVMVYIINIERAHHSRDTQGTCVRPLSRMSTRNDSIYVIRVNLWGIALVWFLRTAILSWFVIIFQIMHPSLLLRLCSFTLEVNNSFQSFIWEIVLEHLLLFHFVYFRLLIASAVSSCGKLSIAVRGPICLVCDFIVSIPICISVVLSGATIIKVWVVHRSDIFRDFL